MKPRTRAFLPIAIAALACLPAAAQDFGPPGPHRGGPGEPNPILHMAKDLGLNDSQIDQVKTITQKYMDGALGKAIDAMPASRMAVQKLIHDLSATDDQVRDAVAAVSALETQIAVQHHQMALEISTLLTSDQKSKLAEMFANLGDRHPRMHPGGSNGF